MAIRPSKDTYVLGINGWKFKYGYDPAKTGDPDRRPCNAKLTQTKGPPDVVRKMGRVVLPMLADKVIVPDSFANPADGKTIMKPELYALLQWLYLDWVQLQFKRVSRMLKSHFVSIPLPYNVDTLYIVYYLKMNTRDYPVFKGTTISFAVPVKGPGPKWFSLEMKTP